MAGYTKGPWKVERRWSNGCEIVPRITCDSDSDREYGWIADVIGAPYLGHESTLPNAYLIAAAPDLLEACKRALKVWWPDDRSEEASDAYRFMKNVVAKAEGRS